MIDTSFVEHWNFLVDRSNPISSPEVLPLVFVPKKKAGCCGGGKVISELLSMGTILAIVGLDFGFCWTHSKPI